MSPPRLALCTSLEFITVLDSGFSPYRMLQGQAEFLLWQSGRMVTKTHRSHIIHIPPGGRCVHNNIGDAVYNFLSEITKPIQIHSIMHFRLCEVLIKERGLIKLSRRRYPTDLSKTA